MKGYCCCFLALNLLAASDSLKVSRTEAPRLDYARSIRVSDGPIYLLGSLKSVDSGKSLAVCTKDDPPWHGRLRENLMNTLFQRGRLFLALKNKVVCGPGARCVGTSWRSEDGLKSIQETATALEIPEAGRVDNGNEKEWAGLFFHRAIVELRDGSLLAAMYGNFEHDTITPTNPRSRSESKYKLRAFAVRSTDEGRTWRYVSTIAAPDPAVVDESEGFNEWTMVRLADGRLLAIVRTGHYTPLVASWSSDEGQTWTRPAAPSGLGPGGDPFVILLSDGRLAVAYCQIVQPPEPREAYWREYEKHVDQRRRCVLAIDRDGTGREWVSYTVDGFAPRSAYPTIFQVDPHTLVYQADLDMWRVEVPAR